MRRPTRRALPALVALLTLGCGDEGPSEDLTYAELVGNWPLLSLVFTSDADPATTFDFQAAGGSGSLTFQPDTTFIFVLLRDPGSPTESASGPVELTGETITLTDDDDPDLPLLSGHRSGTRLVFETENAEYDFDGDGTEEPARVDVVFEH
jgi:hypothetical protein